MNRGSTVFLVGLVALVVSSVAGCRFDNPESPVQTPPLILRSSVPADSAAAAYDAQGLDLIAIFRRDIAAHEHPSAYLIPAPISVGEYHIGLGGAKQVVWESVIFDPDVKTYRLILDGPTMIRPHILTFYPGGKPGLTGAIGGEILIDRAGGDAEDVLVVALDINNLRVANAGMAYLGMPAASVTLPFAKTARTAAKYRLNGLILGEPYLVFAISDTNNDGEYDVETDWWGYMRSFEFETPFFATAGHAFVSQVYPEPSDIDFSLVAPGTLDVEWVE